MSALPAARTPDAAAAPPLRWGVLGTGWIAERFIRSVQRHTRQQFTAIGSRDAERSADFAARFGIANSFGSYTDLVADPAVDVVYVATPHTAHLAGARLALEAGKHVLVEKPLAINAAQATEIARLAAANGLFCMEALWTFFLPKFDVIRQVLDSGMLGEVRTVLADHGEHFTPDHRITYTEPQSSHDALYFEAAEVARCVTAGERESRIRPLADSIRTLQILDEIRSQIGATLPDEA